MLPKFPRKPWPIPEQNEQSVYPFSDQKAPKTIPFGAAHTYMAYKKEQLPPPPPGRESAADRK